MEDSAEMSRLIGALRPWLHQIVIVGGWAHRFHRFHHLANPPKYTPITTRDADIAMSLESPLEGDINQSLKQAGFEADLRGDQTPAITHYHLGDEDAGFYAEFLAPLKGSRTLRSGKPQPLTIARAGVTAQKLRHLDILLLQPDSLILDPTRGFNLEPSAQILVPNPVTFLAQRLLIHKYREDRKRAQDVLYIHDTIELFGSNLEALHEIWLQVTPVLEKGVATKVETQVADQFSELTEAHVSAASIPQDRELTSTRIRELCSYGLDEIFRT